MKTTRKRYTGEFKAKVALEAIRGDLTLAELAAKHGIHPTMIATWKRQAIEGMAATLSLPSSETKSNWALAKSGRLARIDLKADVTVPVSACVS